jgi:glycosyltransferase involved in cell wall biosynthesis
VREGLFEPVARLWNRPDFRRMNYRIALLTNFLPPYRLAFLRELEKRCESLRILVSAPTADRPATVSPPNSLQVVQQKSVQWRETERHPNRFVQPLSIQFPYDTLAQLKRFRPDVIISAELGLRTLQAAAYRQLATASRLVVWAALSETSERARGTIRSALRRVLLSSADAVVVNGESGARYVERFGVSSERVFRVPPASDVDSFQPPPEIRSEPIRRRLLYSGQLIERKGLIPFVSHVANWASSHSDRQVAFWIAGDGPLRGALAAFSGPPNLSVKLLGHVPYDRLPEIYSRSGLLAFPTLADEWGMVVGEAMASALPVLGSVYSNAVEELVVDGKTGWTFRPDQPSDVKAALHRALAAPSAELDRMGQAARQRVAAMTPAAMAGQMIAAIEYAYSA